MINGAHFDFVQCNNVKLIIQRSNINSHILLVVIGFWFWPLGVSVSKQCTLIQSAPEAERHLSFRVIH